MRKNDENYRTSNLPEGGLYSGSVCPTVHLRLPTGLSGLRSNWSSFSQNSIRWQQLDVRQVGRDQVSRLHCSGHVGADDVSVGQGQLSQPGPRHVGLAPAEGGEDPLLVRLAVQFVLAVPDEDQGPGGRDPTSTAVVVDVLLVLARLAVVPVFVPPGGGRRTERSKISATTNLPYWGPSNLWSAGIVSASAGKMF